MPSIFCVECVCPSGHIMIGAFFDEADSTTEQAEQEVQSALELVEDEGVVKGICSVCSSPDLTIRTTPIRYSSIEDAYAAMEAGRRERQLKDHLRGQRN